MYITIFFFLSPISYFLLYLTLSYLSVCTNMSIPLGSKKFCFAYFYLLHDFCRNSETSHLFQPDFAFALYTTGWRLSSCSYAQISGFYSFFVVSSLLVTEYDETSSSKVTTSSTTYLSSRICLYHMSTRALSLVTNKPRASNDIVWLLHCS